MDNDNMSHVIYNSTFHHDAYVITSKALYSLWKGSTGSSIACMPIKKQLDYQLCTDTVVSVIYNVKLLVF